MKWCSDTESLQDMQYLHLIFVLILLLEGEKKAKVQGSKVCPKQPIEGCPNHVTLCCDTNECEKGEVCCFQEEGCKTACMKPVKNGENGAIFLDKNTCEDFKKAPKNISKVDIKAHRSAMIL
ncbi:hypothetical protein CDAR_559071 [Caerostris darwini]|uniref:Uncharacterized protein n=1 Tax=Caerostris darwini TaxID=1538125 RepID=A0AAV4T8I9_9ARAC|nr:hypothetical protein CDAR_559071 [Caerostris darwini]